MARSESTIRVAIPAEAAFEYWADLKKVALFNPGLARVTTINDNVCAVTLRRYGAAEDEITQVGYALAEIPKHLVWRSRNGARWNGEVIIRPATDESCDITLIIDYEPLALRERPAERHPINAPVWLAGIDLICFKHFVEERQPAEQPAEAIA